MNNIKLFEAYNKEETLLVLAKMGLRTNRREVFDLAIQRGFDVKNNFNVLFDYCCDIGNWNSLEWIYPDKKRYRSYIDNIRHLNLYDVNLTDLTGLSCLTNLTNLNLYKNNLTTLKGIEVLTKLKSLDCSYNKLTDLKGVESLTKLVDLDFEHNEINNISALSELTKLEKVCLQYNHITDITPLSKSINIRYMDICNNDITDLSVIVDFNSLTNLYLEENPLTQDVIEIYEELLENGGYEQGGNSGIFIFNLVEHLNRVLDEEENN